VIVIAFNAHRTGIEAQEDKAVIISETDTVKRLFRQHTFEGEFTAGIFYHSSVHDLRFFQRQFLQVYFT